MAIKLNLKKLLIKMLTQITPINKTYGDGTSTNTINVRRVGNIVFIASHAIVVTRSNEYVNWFGLNDSTLYPSDVRYISTVVGNNANIPALIRIETNGAVSIYCNSTFSEGVGIWLTGSYMI